MDKNKPGAGDLEVSDVETGEANGHVNPVDVLGDEHPGPEVVVSDKNSSTREKLSTQDSVSTDEVERKNQERRDRDPVKFCQLICSWPKLSFALTLVGHLIFLFVTVILMRAGADILPLSFDRIPLEIWDNADYQQQLAWSGRNDNDEIIKRSATGPATLVQDERSQLVEPMEMVFNIPNGNVFTKENLMKMKEVEDTFFNNKEYQDKFCQLDAAGSCTKPNSILRMFDGTYKKFNPVFDDPGFDNIVAVLYTANSHPLINKGLQYHLGATASLTASEASSPITRGYIRIGGPLKGFANTSDDSEKQQDELKTFMFRTFKPIGDKYFKNGVGQMDFVFSSGTLISVTITSLVVMDMSLAIGSLAFIVIFMSIQTGSLWVSLFAVLSIITGFTCANIIYRYILDYIYFGSFHILAVFIILGIGADDVFVFFDTWKQTAHNKYKSLAHRMSDCYRKAAMAMLFTSLTTAQAFVVSATSPFLGISSFGVFAALLVLVNYISVIVFFPTVVIMYHLYFEKYKCCCCVVKPGYGVGVESTGTETNSTETERNGGKRKNKIVLFFRGPFFKFVTHKIARWIILLLYLAFLIVFIYFASTLKVNEESIKFLKDSTNTGRYLSLRSEFAARGNAQTIEVLLVWGLKGQDLSACHHTDIKCNGKTVWDDTFDMNSVEAQQAILNLCEKMKQLPTVDITKLSIRTDLNTKTPEIDCFAENMDQFMKTKALNFPMTAQDANSIMTGNPAVYSKTLPTGFKNDFEIGMSYWLYNGFGPGSNSLKTFGSLLGEAKNPPYTQETNIPTPGGGGFRYTYGTKMRYAAIRVNTSISGMSIGYPKGLPIWEAWEQLMKKELETMPASLKGGFQCTPGGLWHWLKVQETLTSSAVIGIVIGVSVAFPLLVIATHNVIVGLLATLTLCCITVCVVGVIPMAGWKLGMLESLNLVLVVGLSVDYVVHLAEGYSRSLQDDRQGRVRDMLEEVGLSVLSGACTTLGASFFMVFAQILFFVEFGVFMFCTIGLSILFALGFFVTIMGLIGPQNEVGSLLPFYRWCSKTCCRKKD